MQLSTRSPLINYLTDWVYLLRSFWTLTGSPSLVKSRTVLDMAHALQCTPAQVVFRLAQANGITPLAGSTNEKRMKDGATAEHISVGRHTSALFE